MHRPPVAPGEHHRAELLGTEPPGEAQRVLAATDGELSAGDVVGRGGAVGDVGNVDPQRRGARQIEIDVHLVRGSGVDVDRGDPGDRLQARPHGVLDVAALRSIGPAVPGRSCTKNHESVSLVSPLPPRDTCGPVGIPRQGRQAVQAPDRLHQRVLHVRAEREAQVDVRPADEGITLDLLDPRQALHDVLEWLEELGLDFLGGGGAPTGLDLTARGA